MKTPTYLISVGVALALIAGACSGSSDTAEEATSTTSTTVAATTTTTQVQTTTTASTTTTEPPITADPAALLEAVNNAMGNLDSFLATGSLSIADADDSSVTYIDAALLGGQSKRDNSWIVSTMDVSTGDFAGILQFEQRIADGVRYKQNPIDGSWAIDDDADPNPIRDTIAGTLTIGDPMAEESPGIYAISGTYPADPKFELVTITVGQDDFLVRSIETRARQPRSDLAGLVPEGDGDIFSTTRWDFGEFGIKLAPTFAPPEDIATAITRINGGAFQIQIPVVWNEATAEDMANAGLNVDAAWGSDDQLILMVITDDLVEAGVGSKTLDEYVRILTSTTLMASAIEDTIVAVNAQGRPIEIIKGTTDDTGDISFIRLVSLPDPTTAYNITMVGPTAAFESNIDAIFFVLNTFLIKP